MTKFPDLFAALAAPFDEKEVKARSVGGRQARYVTARTVMNRLDQALGPEAWEDCYRPGGDNSVVCRLTLTLPDGTTVSKEDAGGAANMPDAGDDDKSAHSDAFKRAAVKFGVGRYLYGDGVPAYAAPAPTPPPAAPTEARHPEPRPRPAEAPPVPTHVNGKAFTGDPKTGKALYSWAKDREQEFDVALVKYLNQWAKLNDFPGRMVEWDAGQVAAAHREAARKLDAYRTEGSPS